MTRRTLASAALVALLALASVTPAAPQDDIDFIIAVPPPSPERPRATTTPAGRRPPPRRTRRLTPGARRRRRPAAPPRRSPRRCRPSRRCPPPNWNAEAPRRDANGDFCVMAFETRAAGDARARYGSTEPNAFPEAVFTDESDFAPAQALDAASVAYVDANPLDSRAKLLAGCPSRTALCVSSGYGGEFVWKDTFTTDQSVFQENQNPTLDVTAALFPAQPEGFPARRGWNGEGWSYDDEDHRVETEMAQGMELFATDLYRLVFRNGHVLLGPGATCSETRRANLACPDRYFENGTLADNFEEIQRVNFSATFPGRPPLVKIGSYPPGRWAHVRVSAGMSVPEEEPEKMGKMFVITADARFQGATPSTGTTRAYVRLTDRIGPVRVHHRGTQRRLFSPPPSPPFAPGYRLPPTRRRRRTRPVAAAAAAAGAAPPYYPPCPPSSTRITRTRGTSGRLGPHRRPHRPRRGRHRRRPRRPRRRRTGRRSRYPPACVDSLGVSFVRAVARAGSSAGANASAALAWEEVVLSSRRFEEANVSRDLGLDAYEADPGMGHAVLEKVSRVSTTVPPETCDNPFVTHTWRVTRAPNATVPVPYTPWVDPLAPPAPEVDLDAIDESIPEWMRKYDFPPPPPSPPPPPPPPDLDASDAATWRHDFTRLAHRAGLEADVVPDGPGSASCAWTPSARARARRRAARRRCAWTATRRPCRLPPCSTRTTSSSRSRRRASPTRVSGPPPTNDTVTSSGTPRAFFSALDAGARVSTYAAVSPKRRGVLKQSWTAVEPRPGGRAAVARRRAFVTVWSVVSAPPSSALRAR